MRTFACGAKASVEPPCLLVSRHTSGAELSRLPGHWTGYATDDGNTTWERLHARKRASELQATDAAFISVGSG